jgi:glucosamine kinase
MADEVLAHFGHKPEKVADWAAVAIPRDYARFAPIVLAHAEQGDAIAKSIVVNVASDATMLIDRLLTFGAPKVAMIGGLFPRLLEWLPRRLRPHLVQPERDPTDGAILMAQAAKDQYL